MTLPSLPELVSSHEVISFEGVRVCLRGRQRAYLESQDHVTASKVLNSARNQQHCPARPSQQATFIDAVLEYLIRVQIIRNFTSPVWKRMYTVCVCALCSFKQTQVGMIRTLDP